MHGHLWEVKLGDELQIGLEVGFIEDEATRKGLKSYPSQFSLERN